MADERSDIERRLIERAATFETNGRDRTPRLLREAADLIGECRRAMAAVRRAKRILMVPAAEYVPAIPDAWEELDAALDIMAGLEGGRGDGDQS